MILKNKKRLAITSLLILLPIPVGLLLWKQFPATMAIHWGITGQPDGWAGPILSVVAIPLTMLALHLLCILFTLRDPGNKNRNQKMLSLVVWVTPVVGNISCFGIYALALGWKFSPVTWTMLPMGLLFAVIGNYMPKTRMNSIMGIKIYWTYTSEANWNATHRFAGKVWMIGGIAIALCALLPHKWAIAVMMAMFLLLVLLPTLYSRRYYKKELAEGKELKAPVKNMDRKTRRISIAALVLLAVFLSMVLFFGDIRYTFREAYLFIDTNMYSDYVLDYDRIDTVEYREGNVSGLRVGGYGSFRLLMGWFENDEFGTYLRYTYYKPEACVVVTAGDQKVLLSAENAEQTRQLYLELLERVN